MMYTPQVVDIQPNDGFGTLLPLETIDLDVIFSAEKPKVVIERVKTLGRCLFIYIHRNIVLTSNVNQA